MPEHKGPDMQEDRDLPKFDYITYMERYMNAQRGEVDDAADDDSDTDDTESQVNGG
jgi:hypothetical protein